MSKPFQKSLARRSSETDPVEVFCRVKPIFGELSCIKVLDSKTILVTTPEVNNRGLSSSNSRGIQYTFEHVFDEKCSQKEVFDRVAFPLVEGLISGKNGLLFTYGVSGSGKTFTMNGVPENGGILPRCLDVLFNSISSVQARKFVFKPDGLNGFDVQSNVDAMLDYQKEMRQRTRKTPRKVPSNENLAARIPDVNKVGDVDDDCLYSVFVSHVEIYNNLIYDLLDDCAGDDNRIRNPQSKILREDASHNMFVHSVTEVEITSTEEAFEVFYKGQKRKRMAHTLLNAESSRSHSVFTVRVVRAPLNSSGDEVLQEKNIVSISQLSMVDLAGSERTNRTKNSGQRLREAGNINNSLMTLRTCFELLRENQTSGTSKVIPYRQSRLTHLFKSYFDGEGQVKMIVCVNPKVADYDESIHVLKFAEMSQEIQVVRPNPVRYELGFTPGRRRANINARDENGNCGNDISPDLGIVYSLGPEYPPYQLQRHDDSDMLKSLSNFLQMRLEKKKALSKELTNKELSFRNRLIKMENDNVLVKQEVATIKAALESERRKKSIIDSKLVHLESLNTNLEWKVMEKNEEISTLKNALEEVKAGLNMKVLEKEKEKQLYKQKMLSDKQRAHREIYQKQKEIKAEYKNKMKMKDEKLRLVKEIVANETLATPLQHDSSSSSLENSVHDNPRKGFVPPVSWALASDSPVASENAGPMTRHRRSLSAPNADGMWLDHRPVTGPLPLNTVLQPNIKKRKSVTQLTNVKDLSNPKTSKYCLTTEADVGGEVETRLYKGDIIATNGGGAQVVFNEVETLRQVSPTKTTPLKRRSDEDIAFLVGGPRAADRCKYAVEGHGKRFRR
ncbi:kinesin-like protein KIF23 [Ischnura elegans]|uniref:kinesin-like protein KIF23 n=1 Tax=Ischnura elegans TaxID=197161 RepID=UPI001ED8BD39|nr:kinesin-like protein KIF23 [Ischnura elegans]